MTQLDYFGHWGYAFLALGMLYLSMKDKAGWAFRFFGEGIWVILGFWMGMTSIWMWGLIFMAVDVYGYQKWQLEHRTDVFTDGLDNAHEATIERLNKLTNQYNDFCTDFNYNNLKITEADILAVSKELISSDPDYWDVANAPPTQWAAPKKKRKTSGKNKNVKRKGQSKKAPAKHRRVSDKTTRSGVGRSRKSSNGKSRR